MSGVLDSFLKWYNKPTNEAVAKFAQSRADALDLDPEKLKGDWMNTPIGQLRRK